MTVFSALSYTSSHEIPTLLYTSTGSSLKRVPLLGGASPFSPLYSSRKIPYPPHGRSLEIPSGRGILKAKLLEATYENKLEFPWGRGVQDKKPSMGGVWIFSGTAPGAHHPKPPTPMCSCNGVFTSWVIFRSKISVSDDLRASSIQI